MKGQTRYCVLWAGTAAVIIYGSLYPFQFVPIDYPGGAVKALLATWAERTSLGDILANLCLYMPFGFLAVLSLSGSRWLRFVSAITIGTLLSATMELLQLFDEGRCGTMSDVRSNFAGSVLGAVLAILVDLSWRDRLKRQGPSRLDKSALVPLVCWAGYRLFPYVPVIDLHKYWQAVRPLLTPEFEWLALCRHAAAWLAVAAMLGDLCPPAWRRFAPLVCFSAITCARVAMLAVALSASELAGGAIGLAVWVLCASRSDRAFSWIAAAFAVNVVIQGLAPFHFVSERQPFTWIPFYGLIAAEPSVAVPSFLEKGFTYGALVWLLHRAGAGSAKAVMVGCGLVGAVTVAHLHLPGRSFEISDCLLLLSFATIEAVLRTTPSHAAKAV